MTMPSTARTKARATSASVTGRWPGNVAWWYGEFSSTSGETTFRRIPRGACPVYCLDERRRKGRVLADRSKPVEA